MARQRFVIDKDGNRVAVGTPQLPANSAELDAWNKMIEAQMKAIDDFDKQLITTSDLQAEMQNAVQRFGKRASLTVDQRDLRLEGIASGASKYAQSQGKQTVAQEAAEKTREDAVETWFKSQDKLIEQFEKSHIGSSELLKRLDSLAEKIGKAVGNDQATIQKQQADNARFVEQHSKSQRKPGPDEDERIQGMDAARKRIDESEKRIFDDLKRQIITSDQAKAELDRITAALGRSAGFTVKGVELKKEDNTEKVNEAAAKTGQKGITQDPTTSLISGLMSKINGGQKASNDAVTTTESIANQLAPTLMKKVNNFGSLIGKLGEGGAGLKSAGGPVAAGLTIAEMASDEIASKMRVAAEAIDVTSRVMQSVARNDWRSINKELDNRIESAFKKIPITGELMSANIAVMNSMKNAFQDVTDALNQRARQLYGFGAANTTAIAEADVRKLLADIREAQKLDKGLAAVVERQSKIETNIQDAFTPIKDILLRLVEGPLAIMEFNSRALVPLIESNLKPVVNILEGFKEGLPSVLSYALSFTETGRAIARSMERSEAMARAREAAAGAALWEDALKLRDFTIGDFRPGGLAADTASAVPMGIPLFE